ncbi:unnamed protein product, partial [Prorocentrum cordatum]
LAAHRLRGHGGRGRGRGLHAAGGLRGRLPQRLHALRGRLPLRLRRRGGHLHKPRARPGPRGPRGPRDPQVPALRRRPHRRGVRRPRAAAPLRARAVAGGDMRGRPRPQSGWQL